MYKNEDRLVMQWDGKTDIEQVLSNVQRTAKNLGQEVGLKIGDTVVWVFP